MLGENKDFSANITFCFAIHLQNKLLQMGMKIVPMITEIVTIFLTSPTLSVSIAFCICLQEHTTNPQSLELSSSLVSKTNFFAF